MLEYLLFNFNIYKKLISKRLISILLSKTNYTKQNDY